MNNYLDIDALKSLSSRPQYFGLGFIQFKINNYERLHFYDDDLYAITDDTEMHDHRYNFTSTVLKGAITNEIFTYTKDKKGLYGNLFELMEVSCDSNTAKDPKHLNFVIPELVSRFKTSAVDTYVLGHSAFHKIKTEGKTITLLERDTPFKEFAQVIKQTDKDLVCPFSSPWTQKDLWDKIESIIYSGYHITEAKKGVVGNASKILEEAQELLDAEQQDNKIMQHVEMSDIYGALEQYADKMNLTMDDLKRMSDATTRAFKQGARN